MRWATLLPLISVLAGCASDIPRPIREAPAVDISMAQVLAEPESLRQNSVRWGGAITGVENRRDETWIEIVEHPLGSDGLPRRTDLSGGRFLARVPGFIDPSVYARKRLVTVAGQFESIVTRNIGEHPYRYPVVRVDNLYLWPQEPTDIHHYYYYAPYWHDYWYPRRIPPPPPPPPPRPAPNQSK
jgi:outer membrane lipoprotein